MCILPLVTRRILPQGGKKSLRLMRRRSQQQEDQRRYNSTKQQSSPGRRTRNRRTGNQREQGSSSSRSGRPTRSWRKALVSTVAILTAWYLTPVSEFIIDILIGEIPIQADLDLGRQARAELSHRVRRYDPHWSPLLEETHRRLIQAARSEVREAGEYAWKVEIIDIDIVNAYALPDGSIRIGKPLLDVVKPSPGELAGLIGHEMGHILSRHSQKRMLHQRILNYLFEALVYEDNDDHNESFGEAVGELLLKSANWLGQQSFSRKDEYEADNWSWKLLQKAEFNPQGMANLLTKLSALEQGSAEIASLVSTFTRSHPATSDRIEALNQRWEHLSPRERTKLVQYRL